MTADRMTKGEREDLYRLVRDRKKVMISAAKQRTAEMIADFENQMGQEYSFDQDEIWAKAMELADAEVQRMQKKIAARCKEMGIPDRFAPSISLVWHHRGYDNAVKRRRDELRRMAVTQIEAIEQKAIVEIELSCLKAQERIAMAGLTSDAAKEFIAALPSVESLMPALSFAAISGEADPPIAEQLVSANALRQRRFRERQKALQNASPNAAVTPPSTALPDETE
jgi:hypothetical protein